MPIQVLVFLIRNLTSSHFDHLVIDFPFTKTYLSLLCKQELSWSYHLALVHFQLNIFLIPELIVAYIA